MVFSEVQKRYVHYVQLNLPLVHGGVPCRMLSWRNINVTSDGYLKYQSINLRVIMIFKNLILI